MALFLINRLSMYKDVIYASTTKLIKKHTHTHPNGGRKQFFKIYMVLGEREGEW